ncbi:para-aminobenzoate synthase, (PABA) [Friedmanniomyces endolithicus]|uniref:aminodeoxychorismate synthase n=1 Tax=Friedmanniomyces endolithicus TaxID=329885 RepID=A0AAN6QSI0_9PEZI|nr:para-aminobenzoate synthase, (PABA) [Friedmanniomyces endolithicus]KAK0985201.1 para-aminobenzoate synthase, (PABA) [Friedmanniomyces endolithicus]
MPESRILYLDAYDSFSNNIITLLKDSLPVTVETIKIDDSRFVLNDDAFHTYLSKFDAVVAGPGPGHPAKSKDVGLIGKLWSLPEDCELPVLGICLGFQSFALAFGAKVERLEEPRHGLVRHLTHCDRDILYSIGELHATHYHSLHIRVEHDLEHNRDARLWEPSRTCKQLLPLAWDFSDDVNGTILVAARHCHKPLWGVQYHPESICSSGGAKLIESWWGEACRWNAGRMRKTAVPAALQAPDTQPEKKLKRAGYQEPSAVHWRKISYHETIDVANFVNLLRDHGDGSEPILLESALRDDKPVNAETGRFTIIGLPTTGALQILWSVKDQLLVVEEGGEVVYNQQTATAEVFAALDKAIDKRKAHTGPAEVPFWGGLVGYISYEAGLDTIDVLPAKDGSARPDVWFVLVERSIVIDHVAHVMYAQTIQDNDQAWLNDTNGLLRASSDHQLAGRARLHPDSSGHVVAEPTQTEYCAKVRACQEQLRAGESYELCLTDQTLIHNPAHPWTLYQRLRKANPAPFGAYLHFAKTSTHQNGIEVDVIGSSPERFISWSRSGKCQFRPIKGTVKKTPGMTKARAEALLSSEKERAENLMIVDLIRHDLNGVKGYLSVQNVRVPQLMQVEEYTTLFQLVSVISGDLHPSTPLTAALANSLPPGSMTGAPKKRSCELLRTIEGAAAARGLYSGVLGYLDVGGGGDFSVVIRSAFRWSDEGVWRVGAGGAVTALSEEVAEWEEMLGKRQSLVDVLVGSP